jgi:hypothetical protein
LEIKAQSFCATVSDVPDILQTIPPAQFQIVQNTYTVRIFLHIIRRSDGTGGQTLNEIETALSILNTDYEAHNITFSLLGIDEIKNNEIYNRTSFSGDNNGDGKFDDFSPNSHSEAIDIYLFPNDKLNYGLASGIPGTALVIGGNLFGSNLSSARTISHEMGHCLGLYHTFHGLCESGCAELPNGSNGSTCGDFVADTPADPQTFQVNQNTCTWNGVRCNGESGNQYNPDVHLIMAYVPPNCMQYHTSGQGARMRTTLANSSLLQNVADVCPHIIIYDRTYPSNIENILGKHNFTVTGCLVDITNSTINANTTVNINAQNGVTIEPDFWAMQGSNVTITSSVLPNLMPAKAPNNENMLTSLERIVTLPQTSGIDFTVYPNPNNGNFTVEIMGDIQPYTVEIFNASGGMLGKVNCDTQSIGINRTDLPAGIYYLRLGMNSKQAVKKLIVK